MLLQPAIVSIQYSGIVLPKELKRNLISTLTAIQISTTIVKENAAFFLLIDGGKLPPPKAAKILSTRIRRIGAEKVK